MSVITVANLKGGTAKTTSAVFLAHALAASGRQVLFVDADPQGSALRWSELAEWPFPALGLAVRDLHRRLPGIAGDRYDLVVIDTPPLDEQAGVVYSALRAATHIVVPMAPTTIEFDRLSPVWAAVEEVAPLRDGPSPVSVVLLNRTVPNASSTEAFRLHISDAGHQVLSTAIPRREQFAQAYGAPVDAAGPYTDAAEELLKAPA
jgi:chromosome partitioning protein